MKKTYTVVFNPSKMFTDDDNWGWTQVAVEATTFSEALGMCRQKADQIMEEKGYSGWKIHETAHGFKTLQEWRITV